MYSAMQRMLRLLSSWIVSFQARGRHIIGKSMSSAYSIKSSSIFSISSNLLLEKCLLLPQLYRICLYSANNSSHSFTTSDWSSRKWQRWYLLECALGSESVPHSRSGAGVRPFWMNEIKWCSSRFACLKKIIEVKLVSVIDHGTLGRENKICTYWGCQVVTW